MTNEERIKATMEECGLSGFEVRTFEGCPQYVAKTAEGKLVGLTNYSGTADDGKYDYWYYDNGDTGWKGDAGTLDEAIAALESGYSKEIIKRLRRKIKRFESRDAESSEFVYISYLQGAATRDEHVRVALAEVTRLTNENVLWRNTAIATLGELTTCNWEDAASKSSAQELCEAVLKEAREIGERESASWSDHDHLTKEIESLRGLFNAVRTEGTIEEDIAYLSGWSAWWAKCEPELSEWLGGIAKALIVLRGEQEGK